MKATICLLFLSFFIVIVIIKGLVTATIFTLLVFPIFYFWAVKSKHVAI